MGRMPDKQLMGSEPIATATSMRPSGLAARARRKCSAPCFCVCQCMPVVRSSPPPACGRRRRLRFPVSGLRVKTNGQVIKRPRVLRPAFQDRKFKQREIFSPNDFLAGAGLHGLRKKGAEFGELRQHFEFVEQPLRRLHVQKPTDPRRHIINMGKLPVRDLCGARSPAC